MASFIFDIWFRPLISTDLGLLSSLEQSRLGNALASLLTHIVTASAVSLADSNPLRIATLYEAHSNTLLKLAAYCGGYSAQSGKRFDVQDTLEQVNAMGVTFDSLMYELEPDVANFIESSDDLKVLSVPCALCFVLCVPRLMSLQHFDFAGS